MSEKYYYIVMDVTRKKEVPLLDQGRLPIFYSKKVAKELSSRFSKSTVRRIYKEELHDIIGIPDVKINECPHCHMVIAPELKTCLNCENR